MWNYKLFQYCVPTNPTSNALWIRNIGVDNLQLSKRTRICSNHFTPNSFIVTSDSSTRRLQKNALPTLKLHGEERVTNR